MEKFIQLAHRVFGTADQRNLVIRPLLQILRTSVLSWIVDSKYSSGKLESVLQELFGRNRSLLEGGATFPGKKFAVIATTIRDSVPCLFGNYSTSVRGTLARCGYRLVKPKLDQARIKLWEAYVYQTHT